MSLGKRLKDLRTERGLLQSDISDVIDIGVSTISAYERDEKKPKYDTLLKLANYFGVTVDTLYGTENSMDQLDEDFPDMLQVLRRASKELTPEAKRKMVKLMNAFLEEE